MEDNHAISPSLPSDETISEPEGKVERAVVSPLAVNSVSQTNGDPKPTLASLVSLLHNKAKANSTNPLIDQVPSDGEVPSTNNVPLVAVGVRTVMAEENNGVRTPLRSLAVTKIMKFDEDDSSLRRRPSFTVGSSGSAANSRRGSFMDAKKHDPANPNESDLRKCVFQHGRGQRLMSGLRVHALTRQAFVSSFTVGLAIGSIVAIVLKVLKEVTTRLLFS